MTQDPETHEQTLEQRLATMDAVIWAREWCAIAREIEAVKDGRVVIDEGWMISWFANAIMRGYDAGQSAALRAGPRADGTREALEKAFDAGWQAHKKYLDRSTPDGWFKSDLCRDAIDKLLAASPAPAPTTQSYRPCECPCGCGGNTIAPGRCMACRVRESCRKLSDDWRCESCGTVPVPVYHHDGTTWCEACMRAEGWPLPAAPAPPLPTPEGRRPRRGRQEGTVADRLCARCKHPDHWHRHDDEACGSTHPQPCYPETAPFRCLGYDCDGPGFPAGTPESRCGCPSFVEAR